MTSLRRVFFSLSAALWSVSIADGIVVSGYEGGEAEISCSYGHGYENYNKYLCNRSCANSDIVIETQLGVQHTKKGSFSLHDDIKRRVFTVNVTKLTLQHAGIYWCAVSKYGKDIYTEVRLQVVKDWCCDNRALVQGNSQASVSISCPYKPQHKESQKYFCIGTRPSTCLQQATVTSNHNTGRFSLHDNNADGVFTVTITGLTQGDSGMYMCGVHVDRGLDVYSVVHLEVKETTTPLSPSPMTLVTTVTSVTSTSSLSSTSSSLMPPSSAGFTDRTYVFIAFTVMTFSVSLSVLMLALIIIYRCKRIQGSAEPHRETVLFESVYEDVYENTEAVCVNVKLASCKNQYSSQPNHDDDDDDDVEDDDDAQQESVYQDITPYDNIYHSLNITTTDRH
ncbi:polymeric immunoglobulin receptor isoform X2 [Salmo trutta]|uniref:Polymeric immunoglobulin receptor-like n=1 Tax=Salmo trutta TaxID=8032 RepID=A0A674AQT5_SALTR|nr:polymeric immunoglobulin receptor-like isoform X2 [Salmo trutta]